MAHYRPWIYLMRHLGTSHAMRCRIQSCYLSSSIRKKLQIERELRNIEREGSRKRKKNGAMRKERDRMKYLRKGKLYNLINHDHNQL